MWILIVSVFNSNVAFGQLLQLGVIGHHYFEHKAENSNLSFSSFLKLHYANQIKHADDRHHDHKRLPFKSQDGQLTLMSVTGDSFIQQVSEPELQAPVLPVHFQTQLPPTGTGKYALVIGFAINKELSGL